MITSNTYSIKIQLINQERGQCIKAKVWDFPVITEQNNL